MSLLRVETIIYFASCKREGCRTSTHQRGALYNYTIHDPPLTHHGIEQCKALRQSLEKRFSSEQGDMAIIASPMRRTIQTAQLALPWLLEKGVKIEADADWQENSAKPCDTGSSATLIQSEFPGVDFSTVDSVWPDKTSPAGRPYAYTRESILARGQRGLAKLYNRPEKLVFVISHSGFLRLGVVGWWFFNSDYRIFQLSLGPLGVAVEQDESTLTGGLGLSWETRVELGFELPEEDPVVEGGPA
ncbi:hypothetical protein NLU13_6508 [Sarocladium strictum]|uniref:Phosphoglycerate mutase n=1 Tax=Sarocladium strictum TaxID=5046 RepID=A0AA39L769_SARSR|nr:hypothetical protein NLU13_6508 [Sarocladium strictum]